MSTAKAIEKRGRKSSHGGSPNITFSTKLAGIAAFKKALIEQYGEAVRRSKKVGHRVSFRVDVRTR